MFNTKYSSTLFGLRSLYRYAFLGLLLVYVVSLFFQGYALAEKVSGWSLVMGFYLLLVYAITAAIPLLVVPLYEAMKDIYRSVSFPSVRSSGPRSVVVGQGYYNYADNDFAVGVPMADGNFLFSDGSISPGGMR